MLTFRLSWPTATTRIAKYQSWESLNKQEAHTFVQEQKTLQPGVPGRWFQLAIELKETGSSSETVR